MNIERALSRSTAGYASVRRHVVWALAAYLIVSATAVSALLLQMRTNAIEAGEKLGNALTQLADQQTSPVISSIRQALLDTRARLAVATAAGAAADGMMDAAFREILSERPYLREISVLDAHGRIIFDNEPGRIGADLSDRPYFVRQRERGADGFGLEAPFRSPATGQWYIPATLALTRASGSFGGVIYGAVEPRHFERAWTFDDEIRGLGVALLRNDGAILMRVPLDHRISAISYADGPVLVQLRAGDDYGTLQFVRAFDGEHRLLAYRRLAAFPGLAVVVSQSLAVVLAAWWDMVWLVAVGWVLGSAALAGLALWLARLWGSLQAAELRSRQLFEASPYPVYVADSETLQTLAVSDEAVRATGWSRAELLARTSNDHYLPEDLPAAVARRQAWATTETMTVRGLRHPRKDGTAFDAEMVLRRIEYDGRPANMAVVRDVTERLTAERARAVVEEQLRHLFEESPYPLYVTDRETLRIVAVSDEAVRVSGWSREELLTMSGSDAYPPEDLPLVQARRKVFTANETQTYQGVRQLRKDGTIIDVEMAVRVIEYFGRPSTLVMMMDVTDRLRAERAREAAEERNRLLFDASPYSMFLGDLETLRILAVNDETVRLFGWSREELLTMTSNDIYPPEDLSEAVARRKKFSTRESLVVRGYRHLRKDGTTFDGEMSVRLIDYNGRPATLAMVMDVTDRVRAERARQVAEERNRALFESSPHPIYAVKRQGERIVAVNDAAVALYGWSREEFVAMRSNDLYLPEDLPGVIGERKLNETNATFAVHGRRHRNKDGTVIDVELNVRAIDLDGQPTLLVNVQDVTTRNQAEAARLVAETRLRAIMDNTVDGLITIDHGGRILSLNRTAIDMFGYQEAEVGGRNVRILMSEPFRSRHDGYLASYMTTGRATIIGIGREVVGIRKDGTEFPMDLAVNEIADSGGQRHFVGTVRDITRKKAIEDELNRSQAHYRLLFDANPYATTVTDRETLRIVGANPAAERLYGWTQAEMLTMTADDFYLSEDAPAMRTQRQVYQPDTSYVIQGKRHRTSDGRVIDVEMAARIIEYNGRPANLTIITDVSERLQMQRSRAAAEERYRQLFDANPYAIALIDRETQRFVAVNDATLKQYGWSREEFRAMTANELYLPEDLPEVTAERERAQLNVTRTVRGWRHRRKDGGVIEIEMNMRLIDVDGRPTCLAIIEDITEEETAGRARLAAEEQLRQSQKMEVVGQLTGGVAHDFNNILTVILANADALQDEEGLAPGVADRLERITKAVGRASDLTRSLLAFSRKNPLSPAPTAINDLVSATVDLLHHTLGEHIRLVTVLADDPWIVEVDRAQLESALVNLCVNARDAMPGGGRLVVETANIVLDAAGAAEIPGAAAGEYVSLSVADSGSGMPPEVVAKVFEPFFTTKGVGKGTGLGLSMVHGFVTQSGGAIAIDSEPGRGTTFRLLLPRGREARAEAEAVVEASVRRGAERILVVEDEPQVRDSVVGQLKGLGYQVFAAADGEAGLSTFEAVLPPFDLLLTDVVMPGRLNGKALADEVVRRWPATRIAFMSGYTGDALSQDGRLEPGVLLLAKPFRRADLAKIVRQALDGTGDCTGDGTGEPARAPALSI